MKTSPEQNLLSKSISDRPLDMSYTLNSNSSSDLSLRNVTNLDNLSNILMNRSSPTHSIGYLGSAILTKGKTGLGCLQQPLRELYCIFRQNGSRLMQERRLVISIDGLTMLYSDKGVEKFIHNDLASVYDIQLLHLVSDYKKRNYAFLPVDQDLASGKYANLFQPMDRNYISFIENSAHPPVIALIMRRSCGIQALECHVIITRTCDDAFKIVHDIKKICHRFKHEQSQQNNVFDYRSETNYTQIKPGRSLSQLPPKSPATKSPKPKNDEIYDAFQESKIGSKSTTDLSSKSSIFNKIKNFKTSDSKKKSLSSNSEVTLNESSVHKEADKVMKKKSTSSMVNISDSEKKKALKQPSLSSLNQSNPNEKKSKKLSLGKRIINSARSSLKSKDEKKLASHSASSLGSVNSQKFKRDMEKIADVDFRRTSDQHVVINKSSHSLAYGQSACSSMPTNICLENRINIIPSSPATCGPKDNYNCKNRSRLAPSPNQLLLPQCSKTLVDNSINFTKLDESKYQTKFLKLPVPDPKLLANHLIWNKEIGSAECVDKEERQFRAKHMSPVAKVMSPGGPQNFESSYRVKIAEQSLSNYQEENRFRSKSQTNASVYRPQPPSSLVPEIDYSSLRENACSYFQDSAYSSTSNTPKISESEQKDEITNLKSQNIVMNRLKQQFESEQERQSKLSITGHKIVGGVKVFPTLPQEFRLAAEKRQKRMTEIENNLKKSSIEDNLRERQLMSKYSSVEMDNDDAEIIDLTMNKEEVNESKLNASFREIPIQIVANKAEDYKSLSIQSENEVSDRLDYEQDVKKCHSEQINYIYYYDNQQFAGY
ncbi:trithorax group osa-like [Brachionus plicatilis]|uniref:Trithorax group osa-like n=1 Tax=Brachionus plicatilis TaxID=10195 RepID=A0A3M7S5T6_BRAPC|nr:trithorax group osa-like [Brachionus plicatilis]